MQVPYNHDRQRGGDDPVAKNLASNKKASVPCQKQRNDSLPSILFFVLFCFFLLFHGPGVHCGNHTARSSWRGFTDSRFLPSSAGTPQLET